jgi:hypothetical protein
MKGEETPSVQQDVSIPGGFSTNAPALPLKSK